MTTEYLRTLLTDDLHALADKLHIASIYGDLDDDMAELTVRIRKEIHRRAIDEIRHLHPALFPQPADPMATMTHEQRESYIRGIVGTPQHPLPVWTGGSRAGADGGCVPEGGA